MGKQIDILRKFGLRVRELRTQAGLSQEAFADRCGLDRTYISGIERGRRNVALRNLEVLAKTLGVTIAEMLKGI